MVWYAEQQSTLTRPAEGTMGLRSICVPTSAGYFIGDKMERIPLTQGKFAIVDDEDYERLNQYKWYASWSKHTKSYYALRSKRTNGKRRSVGMAGEILRLKYGDKRQSDHIDHNTLDNRRSNLRIVSNQQNNFNRKNPRGYYWNKHTRKYHASIGINGKKIHLGYFQTTREARSAYLRAKEIYHKF